MTTVVPFWTIDPGQVQMGLLALIRLSGLLILAPPVQIGSVPVSVRVGLAFSLVLLVWHDVATRRLPVAPDVLTLGGYAATELGIGIAIGFAGRLILSSASYAAELVSQQMGLGLAGLLDPSLGQTVSPLARLFDWTVVILFLALDGHYLLLGAVVESFRVIPPGHGAALAATSHTLVSLGGRMFSIGMAIVAPTLGLMFLANLALVLVSRTMPQLNLMGVAFPVLIILGLGLITLNLDLVAGLMGSEIRNLESVLVTLLRSLASGG